MIARTGRANLTRMLPGAIGIIIALALIWFLVYVWAVNADENASESLSNLGAAMQKRVDELPNHIAAVKGLFKAQDKIFTDYAEARRQVIELHINAGELGKLPAKDVENYMDKQTALKDAVSNIISTLKPSLPTVSATAESVPQVKGEAAISQLMHQVESIENVIFIARKDYNGKARGVNTMLRYPVIGGIAVRSGVEKRPYFTEDKEARTAPKVDVSI